MDVGDDEVEPSERALAGDVRELASPTPLERIQTANRLDEAGARGVQAAARFVAKSDAKPSELVAAIRFLASSEFEALDSETQGRVRDALAGALQHEDAAVRIEGARALRAHGPGSHRTAMLAAIGDSERRVRWAVVGRFGDHPEELEQSQRSFLLTFLEAGTREEFAAADGDENGSLTRAEFRGLDDQFDRLDRDGNDEVSLEEWASPVPGEIRADVVALLILVHGARTPDAEPPVYDPWKPAADQRDRVAAWREWSERISEGEDPGENEE